MGINQVLLVMCVVVAAAVIATSYIITSTQKRTEEANKKLNAAEILKYSYELMSKITDMLQEYYHISMEVYETDEEMRGHCVNKTVSIITQTLAEHDIIIPVEPEVLKSIAVMLLERAIMQLDLDKANRIVTVKSAELEETRAEVAALIEKPVEDHSDVESVDLGEF